MISPAKIQVRFSDCDMMGHVNNAIYLSYFEMTRIHYFHHLLGKTWDWNKHGVLLRKNEVEYLKPVFLHENVEITLFTEHIGTKSFTMAYELHVNGELRTTGKSVLVCYDSTIHQAIEIPAQQKTALEQILRTHEH